jgi:hypothetical protein
MTLANDAFLEFSHYSEDKKQEYIKKIQDSLKPAEAQTTQEDLKLERQKFLSLAGALNG